MKRTLAFMLLFALAFFSFNLTSFAANEEKIEAEYKISPLDLAVSAKSALLIEADTGTVLYEKNADNAASPASVTKIMTLLLVMEAIDSGVLSLDD